MAKKWSEVVSSERFMSLTPEEQVEAQRQYFDTVVAPQAQERGYDVNEVADQFFTQNALSQGEPVEEEVEPTPDEMVLPAQGEVVAPVQEPVVVEEPIPQTDWTPVNVEATTPIQKASVWALGAQPDVVEAEKAVSQRIRQQNEPPVYLTRGERRKQRQQAELDAQQPASVWAETLEPALGLREGYDATGIDRSHPRWAGMDDYTIASQMAADERSDLWDKYMGKAKDQGPYFGEREQAGVEQSMWDKVSPETLKENAPQASASGATLLDDVYTKKARYVEQGYSPEEAEREAFADAGREALQFTAGVATAPISVGSGMVGLGGRMLLAGATNAAAGAAADVASDREITEGKVLEDLAYGSLGGLGGGAAGRQVGKTVGEKALGHSFADVSGLKGKAVQELDVLGKEAQKTRSMADSLQNPHLMNQPLEGTQTITAREMIDAQDTLATLNKLNAKGASMDVMDVMPSIKNEELRNLLTKATPLRQAAGKAERVIEDLTDLKASEVLGLTSRGQRTATREAVEGLATEMKDAIKWSHESLSIANNFKGATKTEFDKAFKTLAKAQKDVEAGRFTGARNKLEKLDDVNIRELFGSTASDEISRLRSGLTTALEAGKSTKGYAAPTSALGVINNLGIPAITAMYAHPAALVGIPLSKFVARKGSRYANVGKLKELEKAFGGKLKIDDKAAEMLKAGEDVGVVAGYLVQKLMREE